MIKKIKVLFLITVRQVEVVYPLLRWKKQLLKSGIDVKVANKWSWKNSSTFDLVILSNPYCGKRKSSNESLKERILREIKASSKKRDRIAFFDTRDSCVTGYCDLLPNLDLLLKKQVYKDLNLYTGLNENFEHDSWLDSNNNYPKADPSDMGKITSAWNIAFNDYSVYRKPGKIFHWFGYFWPMDYTSVNNNRPYLSSFRGGLSGRKKTHRNKAISSLQSVKDKSIQLGPPISKSKYLDELRHSKTIVSPFGFGEICYRDMETFIAGSILIKPIMNHLDTFPQLYNPWETYIPVKWDFSDLQDVLLNVERNYSKYLSVAEEGQRKYKESVETPDLFIKQFKQLLSKAGIN